MNLILKKCKSDKDWDKLVENSSQGNFFVQVFFKLTNNNNNLYFIQEMKNFGRSYS